MASPGECVATHFCVNPGCIREAKSGRSWGRFCSDRCRMAAWDREHPRQGVLPMSPALEPLPPTEAPLSPAARRKCQSKAMLILGRLQRGPATSRELHDLGGWRFSARIEELRGRHYIVGPEPSRKHGIAETTKPGPDGIDTWELRT